MKVSVVIPNWNGVEKLRRNLPKVLQITGVGEVIVSDDSSTDRSVEVVKKEFPDVRLIKRKNNGGFSANVNTGVSEARGDMVFLLNTDATPEADCLEHALVHFRGSKVFSVSCNAGGSWNWASFKDGFFWHGQRGSGDFSRSHETLWASGGSGIFRKDIWNKLNGLDELFNPFYEEDTDLGYRARKRGFINIWEPKARVMHYKEKGVIEQNFSVTSRDRVAQRNALYFIWKNITSKKLIRQHQIALSKMLLTHPGYWPVFIAAVVNLPMVLEKRKIEEKESVISDEEILAKYPL